LVGGAQRAHAAQALRYRSGGHVPTLRTHPAHTFNNFTHESTLAMRLLATWLINAAALMALPYLMHSVSVTNVTTALIAALVLGLVNTLIRPLLVLLTLPVTLVSMGLFILVINAFLFWLVAHWIEGFEVAGFWSAFLAAILYSVISWALSTLLLKNDANS
jgi:putative membrane protein